MSPPPPRRRIRADLEPTVADGDPTAALAAARNGTATPKRVEPRSKARRPYGPERMRVEDIRIAYAGKPAVDGVTLPMRSGEVLALIGPSGCGKTTLLRSLNRLVELTPTATRTGHIVLDDEDVDAIDVTRLRRRVAMVFQQPNPFPMSIFDNVAYALREQGSRKPKAEDLRAPVQEALERAGLWHEVADDLGRPALRLSGGQQQRLCIARAIAAQPEVLLLDEPCSALDPRSTAVIEELIIHLADSLAIVIVTHNLQQAQRIADHVAFMYLGELVEYGPADEVFGSPRDPRTRDYVEGVFG